MNKLTVILFAGCFLLLTASAAWAPCGIEGYVYCDVNQNGIIDEGDEPLANVNVLVDGVVGATTNADGFYYILDHYVCSAQIISLDESTLPDDAEFIDPNPNGVPYSYGMAQDWLIDSETCHPSEVSNCWLTAGGVKFEPITGESAATSGPKDTVGGVAYPSCSPFPSNGGQWNHVAHSLKLHLIGKDIKVIQCGNWGDYVPGSESPVCDVNYIYFMGTGVVKGIHGNKIEDTPVTFYVLAVDGNEPGNEPSVNTNDGEDIDRYFIRVVDDSTGNVLILVDEDGVDNDTLDPMFDPLTLDPVTITGGNFQMHCTSCD